MDGAWIRVHHWEQNLASPFPILTAMGRATSRIELGTGVINMRYVVPRLVAYSLLGKAKPVWYDSASIYAIIIVLQSIRPY